MNLTKKTIGVLLFMVLSGMAKAYPYQAIIEQASQTYGVEVPLIKAVIMQESRWKPHAVSHAKAAGLMQLMPGTGKEMGITPMERFNARKNIMAGTKYLAIQIREIKKRNGGTLLAVASYNAGRGHIQKSMRRTGATDVRTVMAYLPNITKHHAKETQNYVKQVYKFYKQYGGQNIEDANIGDFKNTDPLRRLAVGSIAATASTDVFADLSANFQATAGSLSEALDTFTNNATAPGEIGVFILMLVVAALLIWAASQIKSYWDLFSTSRMTFKDILFMSLKTIGLIGITLSILTAT